MSFRVLSTFESDNYFQSKVSPKRLPPQESVQHLLFQLEYDELSDPHFQQSRKHLRAGHEMRAIQDCCSPFNFGPRVSRSGLYVKFDVRSSCSSRLRVRLMSSFLACWSPLLTHSCHTFYEDCRRRPTKWLSQNSFRHSIWLRRNVRSDAMAHAESQSI